MSAGELQRSSHLVTIIPFAELMRIAKRGSNELETVKSFLELDRREEKVNREEIRLLRHRHDGH